MLDELLKRNEYVMSECKKYRLKMNDEDGRSDGQHRSLMKEMIRGAVSMSNRAFLLEVVVLSFLLNAKYEVVFVL